MQKKEDKEKQADRSDEQKEHHQKIQAYIALYRDKVKAALDDLPYA